MKTFIYDWEHWDSEGLLHMYIDREALQLILEYYNAKINDELQDGLDSFIENFDKIEKMIQERQAIIDKLKEGNEDDKEV